MSDEPVFDPRHDAVFQRGYEAGSTPRRVPAAAADAPAPVSEAPAAASAPAPAATRGASATSSATRSPSAPAGPTRRDRADPIDALNPAVPLAELANAELANAELLEAPLVPPRKQSWLNPFIIVLWVLGPALLVGGSWLAVRMVTQSLGSTSMGVISPNEVPWDAVLQQLVWMLAPTMISAGVMTMLGLLFWHAWRWRTARR